MKTLAFSGVLLVVGLLSAVALAGPFDSLALAHGTENQPGDRLPRQPDFMMLAGRGSEIGVQIAEGKDGGVLVDEVRPDSPAEKAGLKKSDVIVEFDGERVRGARQFGRLVQETPPGKTVKATIVRAGQRKDVQITPQDGRGVRSDRGVFDGDLFHYQPPDFDGLRRQLPRGFNFDFDLPGVLSGRRLGVTVDELTDQLAQYFGAKEGVLVTAVTEGSAASRAGLKAGDVITSIDGEPVHSRDDLVRALRDAKDDGLTIGIVRDKKETSVKATIEAPSRRVRGVRL